MGTLTTMMLIMLPDYVDEDFAIGGYRQIAGCPRNCNWLTDKGTEGGHNAAANELREGLVDLIYFPFYFCSHLIGAVPENLESNQSEQLISCSL